MPKLKAVQPKPGYHLWLRYDDGAEGEVDLSGLAGRGVFQAWEQPGVFEALELRPSGEIAWGDTIDMCPDALYLRLTGKTPEDIFPSLRRAAVDA